MLLALIVAPPAPIPVANTSPLNTSPSQSNISPPIAGIPLYELPTNQVASNVMDDVPVAPTSPATPAASTLDENLPPTTSLTKPSTDTPANLLPPVPIDGPASTIKLDQKFSDANVPNCPVIECPTNGTLQSEPVQGEQVTADKAASNPAIGRPSEAISPATVVSPATVAGPATDEADDALPADNSPVRKATVDAVPSDSLKTVSSKTISGERLILNATEAGKTGVVDEVADGMERPSPSVARLAELPASVRFAFEEYRQLIASVSSSKADTDEFGQSSTPLLSSNKTDSNLTSIVADASAIDFDKFVQSRSHDPDRSRLPEHHKVGESASATSAAMPVEHPQKLSATSAGAVSEQLAAAIVERLDMGHDSSPPTFRMRLDPRELGTVEVHLSIVHDVVSIRFVAQDEAARQVIERQLDDLRQSLTNSGVSFGQCHVGCNSDGRHSSDQQQAAPPAISRTQPVVSRRSRHQDDEHQVTLPQGRLNVVA